MCFDRLIGAATGLEVARRGAHEWVEGQMDKQTDRRWRVRGTAKQNSFRVPSYFFFPAPEESNTD